MQSEPKAYLDLKVGYWCNNNCIHCVIRDYEAALLSSGKETDSSSEDCLALIAEAAQEGVGTITLTGGEPTIRPDFFTLLQACERLGIRASVQTNGRCFHSPIFCAKLREGCGRPNFVIALHGPNAGIHDFISGRHGSFRQTSQGIRNLCQAGYSVTGKLVISRKNANALKETIRFMASLGVRAACFAFPHGHGNARINYREIVPRYSEIRAEIDRATEEATASGFALKLEAFPLCTLKDPQYVAEFQYLSPMSRRCIPSNAEAFDWDVLRPLDKRKFAQCDQCCCNAYCEGPWKEYPETYGEKEFTPLEQSTLMDLLAYSLQHNPDMSQ